MRSAAYVTFVLLLAIGVTGCEWLDSPPEGSTAESGVVRVTVLSAAPVASDGYRVSIAVHNLRPWTEFDGEFYLGSIDLRDADGVTIGTMSGVEKIDAPPDDLHADVIPPASTVRYVVDFERVSGEPAFLAYDSWESGVLVVPLHDGQRH